MFHLVTYEKTIFGQKIIWKMRHDVGQLRKNPRIS